MEGEGWVSERKEGEGKEDEGEEKRVDGLSCVSLSNIPRIAYRPKQNATVYSLVKMSLVLQLQEFRFDGLPPSPPPITNKVTTPVSSEVVECIIYLELQVLLGKVVTVCNHFSTSDSISFVKLTRNHWPMCLPTTCTTDLTTMPIKIDQKTGLKNVCRRCGWQRRRRQRERTVRPNNRLQWRRWWRWGYDSDIALDEQLSERRIKTLFA